MHSNYLVLGLYTAPGRRSPSNMSYPTSRPFNALNLYVGFSTFAYDDVVNVTTTRDRLNMAIGDTKKGDLIILLPIKNLVEIRW